jgi:nitroreductase
MDNFSSYNCLFDIVKNTRSIRRFKSDPIPMELIDKIIEMARYAPSGYNQQPWDFVVVTKPEFKQQIAQYTSVYRSQLREMEATRDPSQGISKPEPVGSESDYTVAPVYIVLLGDTRTNQGLPMGVRYDGHRLDHIFVSSLANAFLYMHMAVSSLELASQWLSSVTTPYAQCMIKRLLGISEDFEIYDTLVLGYPATKPRPKLMRPKDRMIHFDYCGQNAFRTDEEVRDYIRKARIWTMASKTR